MRRILKCMFKDIISPGLHSNHHHIRVTRRYGTDGTDYRDSKSEFARLKFDIDAGKIYTFTP